MILESSSNLRIRVLQRISQSLFLMRLDQVRVHLVVLSFLLLVRKSPAGSKYARNLAEVLFNSKAVPVSFTSRNYTINDREVEEMRSGQHLYAKSRSAFTKRMCCWKPTLTMIPTQRFEASRSSCFEYSRPNLINREPWLA